MNFANIEKDLMTFSKNDLAKMVVYLLYHPDTNRSPRIARFLSRMPTDDITDLEVRYAYGGCLSLALYYNRKYNWPIYLVYVEPKESIETEQSEGVTATFLDYEEEKPHVEHAVVKVGQNKFFDVFGYQTKERVIKNAYYQLGLLRQDANITLVEYENCPDKVCKDLQECQDISDSQIETDATYLLDHYRDKK